MRACVCVGPAASGFMVQPRLRQAQLWCKMGDPVKAQLGQATGHGAWERAPHCQT